MSDAIERREVLDKGYVELIDFMGDEDAVVDAARVSYASRAAAHTEEENARLLAYLIAHKHTTPFEMCVFKMRIKAPVIVWWQFVRHRLASYNFVSGRYTKLKEVYRVADDAWRLQSTTNKQGSSAEFLPATDETDWMYCGSYMSAMVGDLYQKAFDLYNHMLDAGVAREQARLVLPFAACYYEAIVCMNARSLMNFLSLRQDSHAQSEIQAYANAIRDIVSTTHPKLFNHGL